VLATLNLSHTRGKPNVDDLLPAGENSGTEQRVGQEHNVNPLQLPQLATCAEWGAKQYCRVNLY
jgi:hypothetical protein